MMLNIFRNAGVSAPLLSKSATALSASSPYSTSPHAEPSAVMRVPFKLMREGNGVGVGVGIGVGVGTGAGVGMGVGSPLGSGGGGGGGIGGGRNDWLLQRSPVSFGFPEICFAAITSPSHVM